ncbi:MAG: hypothetical protein GQ529_08630, partial [Methyloprofundus sp.]|nr:hypothetical protein [Methyloprofundus sp.]
MAIILIVDRFGIDSEDALCVEACENAINTARKQINQHLESANASVLRVRLNSTALFKRFSDYEGLNGVLPTQQLLPRVLLAGTLKAELPEWLSDELIVNLGLLQSAQTSAILESSESHSTTQIEESLLKSCDADLFSGDINLFIKALAKQNQQFLQLLNIEAVQSCFKRHLVLGLSLNDEAAVLLVNELLKTNSIGNFLSNVAYQQHLQLLRTFISEYQLNQALPAKNLPESVLHALPMLSLAEENAGGLAEKFIAALQIIERRIFNQEFQPETLCHGLIDWPSLLTELSELIETNRELICAELLAKLAGFKSEQSQTLLSQLQQRTRSYPLL